MSTPTIVLSAASLYLKPSGATDFSRAGGSPFELALATTLFSQNSLTHDFR